MNAPLENSQKFVHRTNQVNGLIQSVCSKCYALIAVAQQPRLLEFVETRHKCKCALKRPEIHVA